MRAMTVGTWPQAATALKFNYFCDVINFNVNFLLEFLLLVTTILQSLICVVFYQYELIMYVLENA